MFMSKRRSRTGSGIVSTAKPTTQLSPVFATRAESGGSRTVPGAGGAGTTAVKRLGAQQQFLQKDSTQASASGQTGRRFVAESETVDLAGSPKPKTTRRESESAATSVPKMGSSATTLASTKASKFVTRPKQTPHHRRLSTTTNVSSSTMSPATNLTANSRKSELSNKRSGGASSDSEAYMTS